MKLRAYLLRYFFSILTLFLFAGAVGVQAAPPVWSPKVMKPGIAAFTCTSSGILSTAGTEHVLMFADLRDPVGSPEDSIVSTATEWVLTNPRMKSDPAWSVAALGEVSGVDVGTGPTSNVFVSAMGPKPGNWGGSPWANRSYTTAAGNTGTGGEVFRIDGTTWAATLVTTLPNHRGFFSDGNLMNGNSFVGLGNLSYAQPYSKLYVTNLDDGKIYVVNIAGGTVAATFDHGTQMSLPINDAPAQLYTQRYRTVWGIEYHPQANRLFYGLRNSVGQDEIWSLALDPAGLPAGAPCLEVLSPVYGPLVNGISSSVPMDIQFSPDGTRMLVIQDSITYTTGTVTGITPAGTYAGSQSFPMRYAHTSRPVEYTRCNPTQTCGGWALKGTYVSGQGNSGATNCISGDYGYGNVFATPACDSVVLITDCIRAFGSPSYKFGLQISPLGDYPRSNFAQNFDLPLTAPNGIPGTKIQFNDVDVLHVDACLSVCIVPNSLQCPLTTNGNGTLQIQITNLTSVPVTAVNLTNCAPLPLPTGAVGITPLPVTLPGGFLAPGATSAPITITLPGLPPANSQVCFCVQLIGEGLLEPCQQMVCANFNCAPPCVTFATQNVQCSPTGGYTFDLCITNGQSVPFTTVAFAPCNPLPVGYTTGVPTGGSVTLTTPIPNGATTCIPLSFPTLPGTGGPFCFNVMVLGGNPAAGFIQCRDNVTLELPPCAAPHCATITTENMVCPTVEGGNYTVNLVIQNLSSTQPISQLYLTACPSSLLPPGAVSVTPTNGYITLGTPIPPLGTAPVSVPIVLPGLPCTGVKACFCVDIKTQLVSPVGGEEGMLPLCTEMVCVSLPACPCPPCMTVTTSNLRCPIAANAPYSLALTITNSSGTAAASYGLVPSTGSMPSSYAPIQPTPVGVQPLSLASGATSAPITISLPVSPNLGGNYCFDVVLLGANQANTLCRKQVCVSLPRCRCAEVSVASVKCVGASTQVVLNVTNNTNLYGGPYAFTSASLSPITGFTPTVAVPSPNPIAPGSSGTVTFTYSGPAGPKCVNLLMSNANGALCCRTQVCFENPDCEPPPAGLCIIKDLYFCGTGPTLVTFYINNNTTGSAAFNWSMGPASVPGCTSSLAPAAFTPGSGTTSTIGVGASVAVTVPVNTAAIASGTCAGIQVCYAPVSPVAVTPMCCTAKIRCPRRIDPWIQMGSARTVITPGSVVGLPVTFTNTDTKPMVQSLTFTDDSGLLTFRRCCPGDIVLARKPNAGEIDPVISNEAPLTVSLAVGETQTITVFAHYAGSRIKIGVGTIGIDLPPCGGPPLDRAGTGMINFGPPPIGNPPSLAQSLSGLGSATVNGRLAFRGTFHGLPGLGYQIIASTDLNPDHRYIVPPSIPGSIVEPDGTFYLTEGINDFSILTPAGLKAEFYQITTDVGAPLPISEGR